MLNKYVLKKVLHKYIIFMSKAKLEGSSDAKL